MNAKAAEGLSRRMSEELENSATQSGRAGSAFENLFLTHYSRIVAVLFRLVGRHERAEELANDVFWKASRQSSLSSANGNVGGWLYRTAMNLGIDALRASVRRQQYEHAAGQAIVQVSAPSTPLDEVLRAEKCRRVRAVLALLKPAQAQILILRSSGFSYNELGECLGVQRGSVGTMLARAEAEFRKRYTDLYDVEEGL